jgi:hypothetical protein
MQHPRYAPDFAALRELCQVKKIAMQTIQSIACVMFVMALYYTFAWAFTGEATLLDDAWINFGLAMSFLVFPWGLDSTLMRIFPAIIFPVSWYRSSKPIKYFTGIRAFFAGFGIMCAGAPGAAHYFGLASQAIQNLF